MLNLVPSKAPTLAFHTFDVIIDEEKRFEVYQKVAAKWIIVCNVELKSTQHVLFHENARDVTTIFLVPRTCHMFLYRPLSYLVLQCKVECYGLRSKG